MRENFVQQQKIGLQPISKVKITLKSRDELPPVLMALQYIFITPKLNKEVFKILNKAIDVKTKNQGRKGMSLWEIFVLAVVRNSLDTNYDRLHDLANNHVTLQEIMGVYTHFGYTPARQEYGLQTIKDNVKLLSKEIIDEIDALVVKAGHSIVKKKEEEKLKVKVDTYVLESNVHFPTDLSLLWDSVRKVINLILFFVNKYKLKGWRKNKFWLRGLKGAFRISSRVHKNGGKNKSIRLKSVVGAYLKMAKLVLKKTDFTIEGLKKQSNIDIKFINKLSELIYYKDMLLKHIDLVERRIIKDETIPASEKLVSIFETHTEWLQKGKSGRKRVEFGHNLLIATDQYQFIVYHKVIEKTADVDLTEETVDAVYEIFPDLIYSMSFDKGFSSKKVKSSLKDTYKVEKLIIPKRGKLNKEEKEEESEKEFKQLKNAHSRVESDINRLEHNGLNTCPDKGFKNFKRYASLGVLSYNLHNLGRILIKEKIKEEKKKILKRA